MGPPFRIAFRREGRSWNAYVAPVKPGSDSMAGAVLIGSIAIGAVESSQEIRQDFMELMKRVVSHVVTDVTGVAIERWEEPVAAPESERAGHA